jgi:beclin 1
MKIGSVIGSVTTPQKEKTSFFGRRKPSVSSSPPPIPAHARNPNSSPPPQTPPRRKNALILASTVISPDNNIINDSNASITALTARLNQVRDDKAKVAARRVGVQHAINAVYSQLETLALKEHETLINNELIRAQQVAKIKLTKRIHKRLEALLNINVINDAFFIWHSGDCCTINNLRLGKRDETKNNPALKSLAREDSAIAWPEINAALGTAAQLLDTIVRSKYNEIIFSTYKILPLGAFSKVIRLKHDDKPATVFNLFYDGSYSIFSGSGQKNFNSALKGLLWCLHDASEYITQHDKTMAMPYSITIDRKTGVLTIGGLDYNLGVEVDNWTKAMKYFLTNLKWLVAYQARNGGC